MPRQHHYYGENNLHRLTANIYRRTRIFDTDRFKLKPLLSAANGFTETLGDVRGSKQAAQTCFPRSAAFQGDREKKAADLQARSALRLPEPN